MLYRLIGLKKWKLTELSDHCKDRILSYLNLEDLAEAADTSSQMIGSAIRVFSTKFRITELTPKIYTKWNDRQFYHILKYFRGSFQKLRIDLDSLSNEMKPLFMERSINPNLRSLHIENIDKENILMVTCLLNVNPWLNYVCLDHAVKAGDGKIHEILASHVNWSAMNITEMDYHGALLHMDMLLRMKRLKRLTVLATVMDWGDIPDMKGSTSIEELHLALFTWCVSMDFLLGKIPLLKKVTITIHVPVEIDFYSKLGYHEGLTEANINILYQSSTTRPPKGLLKLMRDRKLNKVNISLRLPGYNRKNEQREYVRLFRKVLMKIKMESGIVWHMTDEFKMVPLTFYGHRYLLCLLFFKEITPENCDAPTLWHPTCEQTVFKKKKKS